MEDRGRTDGGQMEDRWRTDGGQGEDRRRTDGGQGEAGRRTGRGPLSSAPPPQPSLMPVLSLTSMGNHMSKLTASSRI